MQQILLTLNNFLYINILVLTIINYNRILVNAVTNLTDLSYELNTFSKCMIGTSHFRFVKKTVGATRDGSWIAYNEFCSSEMCGTYMNAPYHLYKYGWKIGDIPLSHLILPALVLDISDDVTKNGPDTVLETTHLQKWSRLNTPLPNKFILLIYYGWSQHYGINRLYFGSNPKEPHYPGLSVSASKWIVNIDKIVGVGVDVASINPGYSSLSEGSAHKILAEHQIYCILNMNITKRMTKKGLTLIVTPLKISGGCGSPVRVIAISTKVRYDIMKGLQTAEYDELIKWYGELTFAICCFTVLLLLICHGLNDYTS